MNLQWYPGHMTKAKRQMEEDIKLIDIIIELVDGRAPMSSRNPDIDTLGANKARVILLNKSDLSDNRETEKWKVFFENKGYLVVSIDSRQRNNLKDVNKVILEACKEKIERDRRRGIKNRPIRAMIVGIPNVGKSTFINSFAGKACTKTGNKPGVTKGKQWIKINKQVELLDTPGILWPKFEDQSVGEKLAFIGSIKDDIINTEELSLKLIDNLKANYPDNLRDRYKVNIDDISVNILTEIGKIRGCIKKGEEVDYEKTAKLIFDDFRSGRLGKITLEKADEYK